MHVYSCVMEATNECWTPCEEHCRELLMNR